MYPSASKVLSVSSDMGPSTAYNSLNGVIFSTEARLVMASSCPEMGASSRGSSIKSNTANPLRSARRPKSLPFDHLTHRQFRLSLRTNGPTSWIVTGHSINADSSGDEIGNRGQQALPANHPPHSNKGT